MSLLIKALDKAQAEKAQAKNAEEEVVKKGREKSSKTLKNKNEPVSKEGESVQELSLSPPEATLFEPNKTITEQLPVAMLDSAVVNARKEISANPLDKAIENDPIQEHAAKLTIQPITPPLNSTARPVNAPSGHSSTQTQAANVFSAKRIEATNQNAKLAVIAGACLIAMLALGAYYYQFLDDSPPIVIPPRPSLAAKPVSLAEVLPAQTAVEPAPKVEESSVQNITQAFEPKETTQSAQKQRNIANSSNSESQANVDNTLEPNEVVASTNKKGSKSKVIKMDKAIASESASIQVTQSQAPSGVNPTLLRAYDAYNAQNDTEAQRLYKQVLQRDNTNIDAMLGLGAIATRQTRIADASGWYRKVLEIEPRNPIAQSALVEIQQQGNPQADETRIRSMLAKTPNDASLHVALGNLYADQNQWSAAQQAYFDAYRLNASAENAFNLGISLDQMGKQKLALPYYQEALQLAQSGTNNIDKAALEARIAAIQ